LEHADPLLKVSIVPRGLAALGYAQYLPKEQYLYTTEQLMDGMCMTMGGRVAEDVIFGKISTGAQNDLERLTKLAYAMIAMYGMNDVIGNVSFNDQQSDYNFTKPYSEETSKLIDEEVRKLIKTIYDRTKELLTDKKNELDIIAKELLRKEILYQSDLERLIGKSPYEHKSNYDKINSNNANDKSAGSEKKAGNSLKPKTASGKSHPSKNNSKPIEDKPQEIDEVDMQENHEEESDISTEEQDKRN